MSPRTLAEVWEEQARRLPMIDEDTLAHMRIAFYLGASTYSALLLNGISCRREVENFFVTNPD